MLSICFKSHCHANVKTHVLNVFVTIVGCEIGEFLNHKEILTVFDSTFHCIIWSFHFFPLQSMVLFSVLFSDTFISSTFPQAVTLKPLAPARFLFHPNSNARLYSTFIRSQFTSSVLYIFAYLYILSVFNYYF